MNARNLLIDAHTPNAVEEFNNGHFGAETTPYAAHFQSNDTATNDNQLFWDFLQRKCTGRADDLLLIYLDGAAGER